jgi:hypothetical protein
MPSDIDYTNIHDPLTYNIVDGIKIYTGTTTNTKIEYSSKILYYKNSIKKKIFTDLVPSTITVKGKFSGISFNEEDIIEMLTVPTGGYILKIGCNYGELINPSPLYIKPEKKKRTSNRGRKPKVKPKSKRKLQGSGKYFSSQITFEIYNTDIEKISKIKLFRNGGFQAPGIKSPNMHDLIKPIRILRDYLRKEFADESIRVEYFISVMRNYTCRLINKNLLIRLNSLEMVLKDKKKNSEVNPQCHALEVLNKTYSSNIVNILKEYVGLKHNNIGIAEIQHNCERYFGLILKFYRPVPWKLTKRTTIKVLRSGKINIDGGNSIEECFELYHWLEKLFTELSDTILFNPDAIMSDSDEYSTCSAESIYDEDIK